ncbi:transposable element Tcb2 transposase [Trichonephila clavipes]|uniref:Transposable element Tcb2 transposase n=1 Tax=Trichonephila clavipes TaxID=2585209 RepID=A0A8X6RSS1_TRICX|nr:transposable element Tcb2 transposase [Trichonephila clavipes]
MKLVEERWEAPDASPGCSPSKLGWNRAKLYDHLYGAQGMVVGSTLVYCYRCTNVSFVNSSTSAAPWIACKGAVIQDPLTANHRRLCLQWAHEHRAWQVDRHQVVFSDESSFNLWDHDGRIRVRRYAGECCLSECAIERYRGRSYNTRSYVQHKQLLPLPAYSPDMSPIEHVWDLVDWCFARHACPEASKDELLLRIQTIWNSLPQANIQNRFESMPRRIAALIAMSGGYTKY